MPLQKQTAAFLDKYTDRSTAQGFQFEFQCERCGSLHRSTFQVSKIGVADGLMSAAAGVFGDFFKQAAETGEQVEATLRAKARDTALSSAIVEMHRQFNHCQLCGKWVCESTCWNEGKQLCASCAPSLSVATAAAQAIEADVQIRAKVKTVDLVAEIDVKQPKSAICPHCGAKDQLSKFCQECGQPLEVKVSCSKCGHELGSSEKFCGECGTKRA